MDLDTEIDIHLTTNKNGLQLLLISAKDKYNSYPMNMRLHSDNGKDLNALILQIHQELESLEPKEPAF